MSTAGKVGKVKAPCEAVDFAAKKRAGGHAVSDDGVCFLSFNILRFYLCKCHAAAYVDARKAGHDTVSYGHGQSDRSYFAGMDVRHDPDPASFRYLIVAEHLKLCGRIRIQGCPYVCSSENMSVRICSFDDFHRMFSFFKNFTLKNGHKNTPRLGRGAGHP